MTGRNNARGIGRAAMIAVILGGAAAVACGQHTSAPAPHAVRPHSQSRPVIIVPVRPMANQPRHPSTRIPAPPRVYPGPPYLGPGFARPAYPGYVPPTQLPKGHLGVWLDQHRNLPVQEQERQLRSDSEFRRLSSADQKRVMQQLHQVNQLTDEQRQRRLARADMIEHLPPQDQARINRSARRWTELPPERQAQMKSAFHDMRAVPLDQRQTMLNSAHYKNAFKHEELGILSDLLRVEPYQPAH